MIGAYRYRDFPLHVSRHSPRAHRRVRVAPPVPGGEPGYGEQVRGRSGAGRFVDEAAGRTVDLPKAMRRRRVTGPYLFRLGAILADLVLPGAVRDRLRESLRILRERGRRLRPRLVVESRELAALRHAERSARTRAPQTRTDPEQQVRWTVRGSSGRLARAAGAG